MLSHTVSICSLCHQEWVGGDFFRLVCSCWSANQSPGEPSLISLVQGNLRECYLIHCWDVHQRFRFAHPDYEQSTLNTGGWLKFDVSMSGVYTLYHFRFRDSSKPVTAFHTFLGLPSSQKEKEEKRLSNLCQYPEDMVWFGNFFFWHPKQDKTMLLLQAFICSVCTAFLVLALVPPQESLYPTLQIPLTVPRLGLCIILLSPGE